jgi:hypothetical protein
MRIRRRIHFSIGMECKSGSCSGILMRVTRCYPRILLDIGEIKASDGFGGVVEDSFLRGSPPLHWPVPQAASAPSRPIVLSAGSMVM